MVKPWEEYYNDPDVINEHPVLREIHAIRLQLRDEREGLTMAEYNALVSVGADAFLAECRKHKKVSKQAVAHKGS